MNWKRALLLVAVLCLACALMAPAILASSAGITAEAATGGFFSDPLNVYLVVSTPVFVIILIILWVRKKKGPPSSKL